MKKFALFSALIFILSGCSSLGGNKASTASDKAVEAQAAIKAAGIALKKARSVGSEWRDSDNKMLKKAKAAAGKGDFKTATKLANKAKDEGEMGYAQGLAEKNAGPWLF